MTTRHYLYLFVSAIFTFAFCWLFAHSADWAAVLLLVKSSKPVLLGLAVVALLVDFLIRLKRWHYIIRRHNPAISLRTCFTPYFSSFALNNLLPFRLGDIARATLFNARLGVGVQPVVSSLVLERISDLVSLLALFFVALLLLAVDTSHIAFDYIFAVSATALFVVVVLVVFSAHIIKWLDQLHSCFEAQGWLKLMVVSGFFCETLKNFDMHINSRSAMVLFSMALLAWVFEALSFALVAYSLNIHLAVDESFFVMSTATLSTLLPSTPGYIGTFDYLCKLALMLVGVDENLATAASLLMHMTNLLPITLIGGVAFYLYFGKAWREKFLSLSAVD